jgi:two-component SAPR family response regulator
MQHNSNIIAIVDDDEMSLFLIRKILERNKLADSILQFTSGIKTLLYLKNNVNNILQLPSIILLDITMPLMSGWQFLDELRNIEFSDGYEPAIVIISAAVNIDFEMLRSYPYIKGYILKPVMPDKLVAAIETININDKENNVANKSLSYR